MKKIIFYFLIFAFKPNAAAQCSLPLHFTGNTGSNMTVMFTPDVVEAFPDNLLEDAYVVSVANNSGLVVGSQSVYGLMQFSLAVWGDDSSTPENDGAAANESLTYYLVNGDELYDIEVTTFSGPSSLYQTYQTAAISILHAINVTFNCGPTYCEEGQWYPPYSGNTGSNMTPIFISGFTSSI